MRFPRHLGFLLLGLVAVPAQAQLQYFGKNKVEYEEQDWRVLQTRHFDVHFYAGEAAMVHDAARLAERAYTELAAVLGHELPRRIPLVLYASHSDFQQTHITPSMIDVGTGGITDLARRRVFLPFNGSWGDFQHVLTHELVHAFEIDILFDSTQGDPLNPFAFAPPLWVMEGLAEYLSRPQQDSYTAMWLRDAALSGRLLSLPQLEQVQDIRIYRFGQSVFSYFAERYGSRRIGDLLRALATSRSLERAFEDVAGVSLQQFSEAWTTAVRRRHLPELGQHQLNREYATPVVTRESENAGMLLVPSISPDGRYLAYVSDAGLTRDLYVRDMEEGRSRRVVHGEQSGDFESLRFFNASAAWAPDGKTLAFVSQSRGEDALNLLDVQRRRVVAKYRFGLDELQTPTFSPDGGELVFVGLEGGQSDLYRVRRDGTDLRRLTADRAGERDPQWSPDGRKLVYVTDDGEDADFEALRFGTWKIALLELESGRRELLRPFRTGAAASPVWSGDGGSIAFIADPDGIPNIYVLHLATSNVFRLTDTVTGVGGVLPESPALSWARGSDRLVFSAFGNSGWDIFRIDRPASVMRPLEGAIANLVTKHGATEAAGLVAPDSMSAVSTVADSVARDSLAMKTVSVDSIAPSSVARDTMAPSSLAWDGIAPASAARDSSAAAGAASAALHPGAGMTSPAAATTPPGVLLPAPEAMDFVERPYHAHLAPDVSQVAGVVGSQGGFGGASLIHFSDLLGDHLLSVGFGIYGSLKDSDLSLEYLNRSGRTNYQFGVFQHQRRYGFLASAVAGVEKQTYLGVRAAAIRPFDKFSRVEMSMQLAAVRGRFFLGETLGDGSVQELRSFAGPGLAYVVDTALFGSTGPIMGRRLRLGLESGFGELDFRTLELDWRQYWSFGASFTLAARGYLAGSWGATPQSFFLGGANTLRGYAYGALAGTHAGLAGLEFRFPLLRYLALGWPLPLELGNVRGVLFAESGSAWDSVWLRTSRAAAGMDVDLGPQVAYGFGTRIDFGAYILRLDWAQLYDPRTGHTRRGSSVAVGADF
ncbi:MAG TPA: BamA/TamA family outer membrane protein [Candidatus Krumholzibacteria bacterium]|nr:BamA/TamA family outer membrane protein [Candidatus Krumholzibacteria bacterium]